MSMIRGLINRAARGGGAGAAGGRRPRPAGRRGGMGGGRPAAGGRSQDEAVGRGVRKLLGRFR